MGKSLYVSGVNRTRLFVFLLVSILGVSVASALEAEKPARPKPPEGERKGPGFAFVCLNSSREPDLATVRKALAPWLEVPAESISDGKRSSTDGKAVSVLEVQGKVIMIIRANFPIPAKDIDAAVENSFMWPEARSKVGNHQSHLIVSVQGKFENPGAEAIFLSRVVAACTEAYDAAGVYWGHGAILTEPAVFRESMKKAANEVDKLPVFLWVSFLRGKTTDAGVDVYTYGLAAFGVMECEVVGSKQRPSDILDLLSGMSAYLIANGNVVRDGDTVGGDEKQQIKAHHAASVIGRKEKVLRIDY